MNFIKSMEFVRITNDKLSNDGLNVGDIVFVAGVKAFPISEEDPYTQRVKFLVHKMNGDNIDTTAGFFMIDPTSVEKIDSEEDKRLYDIAMNKALEATSEAAPS